MATEVALNLPQFYEDDYNPYKMRVLVEEIERLHAALTQDVDDEGVSGTVDSFNGRTGDVVPLQADYDSFFLTQAEADALYLSDAPSDGTTYGRNNGAWTAVTSAPQWGAFNYVFDTNTSMADPGPGFVRFNNATYASATLLAIDDVDDDGNNIEADWLADVTDSTVIRIRDKADHTKWVEFWVNGGNDFVGWRRFDIALKGQSAVAFSNNDAIEVIIDKSQQMEQGDTASSMHDFLYFDGNRWSPSGANLRVNPDTLAGAASQRILAQGVSSSDTTRAVIGLNTGNSVSGLWHVTGATNENFYAQHVANADQFVWGFDNNTTETNIFGMQVDSSLRVYSGGTFFLQERAAARTPIAGYGEVWVRNDTPNTLMFTDDAGADHDLTAVGISAVVEDTSPSLGGSLNAGAFDIVFADESHISFGTGGDALLRYENANNQLIADLTPLTADMTFDLDALSNFNILEDGAERFVVDIFQGFVEIHDGFELRLIEQVGTDYGRIVNDGTNIVFDHSTGGNFLFEGGGNFLVREGGIFAIYDSTNADNAQFSHDGTDFNTSFTATQDWNITLNTGGAIVIDNGATAFTDAALQLLGDAPTIKFTDDGAVADNTIWTLGYASETFRLRAFNDLESVSADAITVDRVGTTIGDISLGGELYMGANNIRVDNLTGIYSSNTGGNTNLDLDAETSATGVASVRFFRSGATTSGAKQAVFYKGNSSTGFANITWDQADGRDGMNLFNGANLWIQETAAAAVDSATYGQWWVKDEAPNIPMFTDDAGGDWRIGYNILTTQHTNTSITLDNEDCGAAFRKTSGTARTVTLPGTGDTDFPVDGVTTVVNAWTSANITINASTNSATLYWMDGSTRQGGASTNRTVGPGGVVTIWRISTGTWYMWGSGIS